MFFKFLGLGKREHEGLSQIPSTPAAWCCGGRRQEYWALLAGPSPELAGDPVSRD